MQYSILHPKCKDPGQDTLALSQFLLSGACFGTLLAILLQSTVSVECRHEPLRLGAVGDHVELALAQAEEQVGHPAVLRLVDALARTELGFDIGTTQDV